MLKFETQDQKLIKHKKKHYDAEKKLKAEIEMEKGTLKDAKYRRQASLAAAKAQKGRLMFILRYIKNH